LRPNESVLFWTAMASVAAVLFDWAARLLLR
jgi:hypothetical protein